MTDTMGVRGQSPAPGAFDPLHFRQTLGHFASGVTIVTGVSDGVPVGFTCQSFSSVSIDPPLILISVMNSSTTYPAIREAGSFAVNVLADHQRELSNQFARRGTDKWAGVVWTPSPDGNPTIDESLMWVDCELEREVDAGDHLIVLGRVRSLSGPDERGAAPLLFFKGGYHAA
jgi:flavin reductase (DIM6/NTAB) family NADH-FMN oxidoreductase RutF